MNDLSTYSDLYKEAFGTRPKGSFERVANMDPVDFQITLESLSSYAEDVTRAENRESERRLHELVTRLKSNASEYGISVETALRWDMDAEQADGDVDYYLYKSGIFHVTEGTLYGMLEG